MTPEATAGRSASDERPYFNIGAKLSEISTNPPQTRTCKSPRKLPPEFLSDGIKNSVLRRGELRRKSCNWDTYPLMKWQTGDLLQRAASVSTLTAMIPELYKRKRKVSK